ncbi:MAG: hypothetical protein COZ31_01510 [Nitrospirae bacterium CG_4_10_14_3_um_filter_44_29]|nr:hypothetical protein [Nitrospirota bacterium]OIO28564.1 MAG: hypothetical protein AUJ60_07200 [Nitrospirae bacterium CG1_02_44_142]PIP69317.1 MAG: hypothetical protein COW90_11395 [Nitrospirae bacterium CG22_combo_CG10-13_8_21_14_all_44_11]PIV40422.1 MAG: hypothetical protein COS28_08990 [Nitrospirae bacterium CG02_land_8_20_14_3_00_44_33]PIX89549.1 MAG: hypothetical protein COZ31_01510 [Nitrospirae bacterium CG_4_10_14_3_um_filter_44_29]PJA82283.1 MAG: hypothetical protein CO147_05545 [Nit
MGSTETKRNQILEAITAPLGFFVLALLIVEAFLATILIGATLENTDKVSGMYLGVGLFVFVTLAVSLLVWFKPDNLTFDKEAHLRNRGKPPFGSESHTVINQNLLMPTEPKGK